MALIMFTPQPNREIALNSDRKTITFAPAGTIELVPASSELFARWGVNKENLLIALDHDRLIQLAGAEFQNEEFELRPPKPGFIDKKAFLLANLIREEFHHQEAQNKLNHDALITLFATHLLRNHSSFQDRRDHRHNGGLPPKTWRTLADYIQSNLSQDLSIAQLAKISGLSPSHFLRAFHRTFGQAPHQYIVTQRLILVEHLVKTTDMLLSDVAKATGFSSTSHMTATMKRLKGSTPTDLRREERTLHSEHERTDKRSREYMQLVPTNTVRPP